jgi:hypothetical protein
MVHKRHGRESGHDLEYRFDSCSDCKIKVMINEVTKIFSEMTDMELSQAIREMKEDGPQGIIREGMVREKCKMVSQIVGGNVYEHLMMTQFSILQEAAYRFTPNLDLLNK